MLIALLLLRDLISETPGTSQFDFQGAYGTRLYFAKNVQTEQFGFHGQYRVTYSDGRPPTTGYASLFSAEKSGDWRVHFFRVEAGALHETQSRMITRVESRKPNPGIAGLNSPRSQAAPSVQNVTPKAKPRDDQFNLLPASDLDDLGI